MTASLRVMQVMAGARHGGAEAFFARLIPALQRAGLDQRAVIRRHPERRATLLAAGVPVRELRFGGPLDPLSRWQLGREIAAFRPQVVLTWMNRATAACPPARASGSGFIHVGRLGGYYDLKYYRRCDHLVANTRDLVAWLIGERVPADRVHHLPNFASQERQPPLARAALDTPAEAPLVLALGRLHRNKAFDVLLAALAWLPGTYLWLAGEGPERGALEALARQLGIAERVRLPGWRDDTPALLAAADVLVCPSRHEPLGNVILEGWAAGVPVVAAASQGPAELIRDDATGLLVAVDDAPALAAAIGRLLADRALAARLAAAGHAIWSAEFSEAAVVGRWMAFFHTVTADAPATAGAGDPHLETEQRRCAVSPAS